MTAIRSDLSLRSAEFVANSAAMAGLVADLRAKVAEVSQGGGRPHVNVTLPGETLARDRVAALIDPGSPFLEFSQLAAYRAVWRGCAGGRDRHRVSGASRGGSA